MKPGVIVEEFGDWAVFAAKHAEDWRRIAHASDVATVFQTWEWNAAWWQHNGRGRRLWAMAFSDSGQTVGLAALCLPPLVAPFRTAQWVGTGGSDYGDLLALPRREAAVAQAFEDALRNRRNRWDYVALAQVRPGAVAESLIEHAAVEAWPGETCPYLALPGDWETFRKGLNKKLRSNVGYYARALEKQFTVEYRTATPETFASDMAAFYELHQKRWRRRFMPGAFASRQARAFHETAARQLLEADILRLHTLTLDETVRGALYCFQKGKRCYYYLGGFEPELARLSLGTVLTAHAIRYAIERDGATEFDFLRGDEPYKYKWGAQDRFNRTLSLTRPGFVRPRLLRRLGQTSLDWEMRAKHYMHQKHGAGKREREKQD